MFSRTALHFERSLVHQPKLLQGSFGVRVVSTVVKTVTEVPSLKEGPERDLINYPRPKCLIEPGKVRFGMVPEEWFDFFYKKTGVTGPYVFGIGFLTYILSKEVWVLEHEYYNGLSLFAMIIFAVKKWGPKCAEMADKEIKEVENYYNDNKNSVLDKLKSYIESEEKEQWIAKGEKLLFDAKRENVQLQLEAAYRERLFSVYREAKNRLDYHVEILNAQRRTEQKHMVSWIVSSVIKGITPTQEKESITKCISDLKMLAQQATV